MRSSTPHIRAVRLTRNVQSFGRIIPSDQLVVVHADLSEVEWTGVQDHIRQNVKHPVNIVRAGFGEGDGSYYYPYQIATAAQLDGMYCQ